MRTAPDDDAAESDRYVFLTLPRCPQCDKWDHLKTYKTVTTFEDGEPVITRYTRCGDCEHKFFVILQ